ncbi:MAG: ECF-type sigma factor, partial [Phycisphaerae bacterium]
MPDDMENSDSNQSRPDVTNLLMRLADGDAEAATDLLPQIYAELRATAGAYFRAQRSDHTLQPTALVHEAYIRLINLPETKWQNRAHFCAVAATAMRHILINHARKKAATNRAHDNRAAYKTMIATASMDMALDLLALDELLETLKS